MSVSLSDLAGEVERRVNVLHWQAILDAFEKQASELGYRFLAAETAKGTVSCVPLPEHRPALEAALLRGRYGDLWPRLDAELLTGRVEAYMAEGEGSSYLEYVCAALGSLGVAMTCGRDGPHV